VGGVSFFFFCGGGRKKQNKFPSNLLCPVKKLNPFLFQIITFISVWKSFALTLVANGQTAYGGGGFSALFRYPPLIKD